MTQTSHRGFTLWLTGLSGAGKTTISNVISGELRDLGIPIEVLDGDIVRTNLSKGLGFSKEDRETNIRRIGFVAQLLSRNGVGVIVAAISPYRDVREDVRRQIGDFVEVYVRCSIDELARRDVKGLYAKAMRGEIDNFTGISDPYEEPLSPEVVIDSERDSIRDGVDRILAALSERGYVSLGSSPRAAAV